MDANFTFIDYIFFFLKANYTNTKPAAQDVPKFSELQTVHKIQKHQTRIRRSE